MSGGRKNDQKDNKESEEGGWASTFLKIAGAAAATTDQEEVILNVDGSRLHDIPSTGCGGVLTDATGKWICGFAQKLNPSLKVDETEKEAILRGLIWVKEKGKKKVIVKCDNEGVVNLVNCGVRSNDPIVCGIREILHSFGWKAKLILTRGDENGVADKLAHKAHSLSSLDLHQYDYPPQNCVSSFNKEAEEGGGSWASTFLKVAGAVAATAAVAGGLYSALKQAEATMAPFQVPTDQTVILNVDGSLLPESAGCGGVLTDASGNWISGFAQKLNRNLKVDETEKEAILVGLLWVQKKGKRKVVVKSDNEGIVNFVNSGVRSNDRVVCNIRDLLNSPEWQVTLVLIPRNANGVADKLAHKAHSLSSFDLRQYDYPP